MKQLNEDMLRYLNTTEVLDASRPDFTNSKFSGVTDKLEHIQQDIELAATEGDRGVRLRKTLRV